MMDGENQMFGAEKEQQDNVTGVQQVCNQSAPLSCRLATLVAACRVRGLIGCLRARASWMHGSEATCTGRCNREHRHQAKQGYKREAAASIRWPANAAPLCSPGSPCHCGCQGERDGRADGEERLVAEEGKGEARAAPRQQLVQPALVLAGLLRGVIVLLACRACSRMTGAQRSFIQLMSHQC